MHSDHLPPAIVKGCIALVGAVRGGARDYRWPEGETS